MSTNEISNISNKIKQSPFASVLGAFASGLVAATAFWSWFYTWRIDDIKSDYEKENQRIKENYELKLEIKNTSNYYEIPKDSELGTKLNQIFKEVNDEKNSN